jgi:hypothetical protein
MSNEVFHRGEGPFRPLPALQRRGLGQVGPVRMAPAAKTSIAGEPDLPETHRGRPTAKVEPAPETH